MADLLDALARSADRLETSYSETAHIARYAAETIRQLDADNARLRASCRDQANVELSEENDRLIADNERLLAGLKEMHIPKYTDPVQELRRVLDISRRALDGEKG
jgi:hypothetical protein